jgi:hypothetical protein
MSNYYSAASLKFTGDDPRLDFTDLFIFASPNDPDKTVLVHPQDRPNRSRPR